MSGELDFRRIEEARRDIRAATFADAAAIELDCATLTYLCPEAIWMLFKLGGDLAKRVVFTRMPDRCRQRIRVMGLEASFQFR